MWGDVRRWKGVGDGREKRWRSMERRKGRYEYKDGDESRCMYVNSEAKIRHVNTVYYIGHKVRLQKFVALF